MNVGLAMKLSLPTFFLLFTFQLLAQPKDSPEFFLRVKRKMTSVLLRAGEFKKHDVVADIGAGDGWLDAALGVYLNSVQFSLEDIDSVHMQSDKFKSGLNAYATAKGKPWISILVSSFWFLVSGF
jgi:hypothetical protein